MQIEQELRVLYVEDEPFIREEISRFLKRRVSHLITAENGKEGLEKFENYPVDLIITDLKMPIMDGLEMTRQIRLKNSEIPVIITTALSDVELMQSSIEIGVERYLLKPIDSEHLNSALEHIQVKLKKKHFQKTLSTANQEETKNNERKIEAEIAKIIKATSGKGPLKVNTFIRANIVEIIISGSRTPLEITLIKAVENKRIADYIRETYYKQIQSEIEASIKQVTGYRAIWMSQECNSQKDMDLIKLILEV